MDEEGDSNPQFNINIYIHISILTLLEYTEQDVQIFFLKNNLRVVQIALL